MSGVGFMSTLHRLLRNRRWAVAAEAALALVRSEQQHPTEDAEAMAIALAVTEDYGVFTAEEWKAWRRNPWRDHAAYQAALAALRLARAEAKQGAKE